MWLLGLVASTGAELMYFPFDEIDSSGQHTIVLGRQLNGTAANSPVLVPGIRGQALSLDGVSQFVDFGDFRYTSGRSAQSFRKPNIKVSHEMSFRFSTSETGVSVTHCAPLDSHWRSG